MIIITWNSLRTMLNNHYEAMALQEKEEKD